MRCKMIGEPSKEWEIYFEERQRVDSKSGKLKVSLMAENRLFFFALKV